MKQSPSCKADSSLGSQEIPRILWNLKIHYHAQNNPPTVSILGQINIVHIYSFTILKIYNTLVLPTFLYGSENWTLTALQRRRIEAAEMKLLRPLAGYTL